MKVKGVVIEKKGNNLTIDCDHPYMKHMQVENSKFREKLSSPARDFDRKTMPDVGDVVRINYRKKWEKKQ